MFPGESTMNQLERIIEVTGKPTFVHALIRRRACLHPCILLVCSKDDVKAIRSRFTSEMLDSINIKKQTCVLALWR